MRARPNLARLRVAAERLRASGPYLDPEEQRRAERRAQREVEALLEAIENGEPLPVRCHPPLSPEQQEMRDAVMGYLDERREAIATSARALREAGVDNDMTRAAEAVGLLEPQEHDTGSLVDDEDDPGT